MRYAALALGLLLVGLVHNNLHKFVPVEMKPWVWNITGALYPVVLLVLIALIWNHWSITLVCLLLIGFSLQVAGCSALYMVAPWPIKEGDELCSARFHAPLGLIGVWLASLVAQHVYLRGKHGSS